jgi:hypothetical protein
VKEIILGTFWAVHRHNHCTSQFAILSLSSKVLKMCKLSLA